MTDAPNVSGLGICGIADTAVETTHELHLRRGLTRLDSEHRALSASSTGSTVERGSLSRGLSSYARVRSSGCW